MGPNRTASLNPPTPKGSKAFEIPGGSVVESCEAALSGKPPSPPAGLEVFQQIPPLWRFSKPAGGMEKAHKSFPKLPQGIGNLNLVPSWKCPCSGFGPKMVFGHNLRYMAPFRIPRAAFCMFFRRGSFVFSYPGADFGAQDRILDSQVDILAWGPFFGQCWGPENLNL